MTDSPILFGTPAHIVETLTKPDGFRFLSFNVSRACNHRCTFCWTSAALKEIKSQSRSDAINWLDDRLLSALLKAFKDKGGLVVTTMSDGEPLVGINYSFIKRLAFASGKLGLCMLLFTNGELLDEKVMSELASLNPKISFSISVNAGKEETYDKVHGVVGAFKKVMKNKDAWRNFDKSNLTKNLHRIAVHTVISSSTTEADLSELKQLVSDLGGVPWIVSTLGVAGSARLTPEVLPKLSEAKRLVEKYATGPTAIDPVKRNCSYISSEMHGGSMYGITIHPFNKGAVQPCPYLSFFGSGLWFSLKAFTETRASSEFSEKAFENDLSKWLDCAVLIEAIVTTASFKLVGYDHCLMRHKEIMKIEAYLTAVNYEMVKSMRDASSAFISDKNYYSNLLSLLALTVVEVAKFRFGKNISMDLDRIKQSTGIVL